MKNLIIAVGYGNPEELQLTDVWKEKTNAKYAIVSSRKLDDSALREAERQTKSILMELKKDIDLEDAKEHFGVYMSDDGPITITADTDPMLMAKIIKELMAEITYQRESKAQMLTSLSNFRASLCSFRGNRK